MAVFRKLRFLVFESQKLLAEFCS